MRVTWLVRDFQFAYT